MEGRSVPGPCEELQTRLENTARQSTVLPQPLRSTSPSSLGGVC